ncbi:hypothetical protein GOBAR_DD14005 [Gossypium barbadense]|nr:hypothetical protein GOBAR_DD14005 [Gossypium barbadense]
MLITRFRLDPTWLVTFNGLRLVFDGMNGAVEVPRPESVTVFEFGSVAATADKVTLAGYCPVSDDLEPCRWEILPANGSDAPQFRVVF